MPPLFLTVPPRIRDIIEAVVRREGGFSDHPADPGRATNMGITAKTLENWRGEPVSTFDVRTIDRVEVFQIYFQKYWNFLHLEHIDNWWIKEFIFDWCVNGGLRNPVRQIQRLVRIKSDGVIGPVTGRAIKHWMDIENNRGSSKLVDCRVRWYIRLVQSRHTRIVFMEGWFNRANHMRYSAPPFTSNR